MKSLPVSFLLTLSRELDVFTDGTDPDPILIRRGLYEPLPVTDCVVVWGYSTIHAAQSAGIEQLNCIQVNGSRAELLELALRLEGRTDGYSWDEKTALYQYISTLEDREPPVTILSLIGASGSFIPHIRKYLSLPATHRRIVKENICDLKTAVSIADLPETVVARVGEDSAACTFSERRIIMRMLLEIMKRDKLTAEQIDVLAEHVLSCENPLEAVTAVRMPDLTHMNRTFDSIRNESLGGSGVILSAPPFFEGGGYSVSFTFSSSRQLLVRIAYLKKLQERCDELFRLLR